jgi:hypothetical protein
VILLFLLLLVVEVPHSIGTSGDTILTAYASAEVLDNNTVLTTIGCDCRAHRDTRGIVTVHARHRYEVNAYRRILTAANGNYLVPE